MLKWVIACCLGSILFSKIYRKWRQKLRNYTVKSTEINENDALVVTSSKLHPVRIHNVANQIQNVFGEQNYNPAACFLTLTPCDFPLTDVSDNAPYKISYQSVIYALTKLSIGFKRYDPKVPFAIYAPTSPSLFSVILACLMYGRPLVTIYNTLKNTQIGVCLEETGAEVLFTTEELVPKDFIHSLKGKLKTVVYLPSSARTLTEIKTDKTDKINVCSETYDDIS